MHRINRQAGVRNNPVQNIWNVKAPAPFSKLFETLSVIGGQEGKSFNADQDNHGSRIRAPANDGFKSLKCFVKRQLLQKIVSPQEHKHDLRLLRKYIAVDSPQ